MRDEDQWTSAEAVPEPRTRAWGRTRRLHRQGLGDYVLTKQEKAASWWNWNSKV